jgi:hypothetical protein
VKLAKNGQKTVKKGGFWPKNAPKQVPEACHHGVVTAQRGVVTGKCAVVTAKSGAVTVDRPVVTAKLAAVTGPFGVVTAKIGVVTLPFAVVTLQSGAMHGHRGELPRLKRDLRQGIREKNAPDPAESFGGAEKVPDQRTIHGDERVFIRKGLRGSRIFCGRVHFLWERKNLQPLGRFGAALVPKKEGKGEKLV